MTCYFPDVSAYIAPTKERSFKFGRAFYLFEDDKTTDIELDLIRVRFDEICPTSLGTLLPAKGNHYYEKTFKVSDSHTD